MKKSIFLLMILALYEYDTDKKNIIMTEKQINSIKTHFYAFSDER